MNNENDMIKELLAQLKQEDSVVRVQMNDERLYKLAEYDTTQGLTKVKVTKDSLQNKFTELKGLVKKGDFTLKTLEDDVYGRWGVAEDLRADALEKLEGTVSPTITGFNIDNIKVADIPEDSKENPDYYVKLTLMTDAEYGEIKKDFVKKMRISW